MIDDPIKYVRDRSTEDADAWAQFCGGIGDGPDAPYPPPGHRHPGGCVAGANQELRVKFAEAIAYAIKEHTPGFDAAAFIRESVA